MKVRTLRKQKRLSFLPGLLLIFLLLPFLALAWLRPAGNGARTPDLEFYPWAYLRDGRPLDPSERTVSVLAVGDVMLGRGVSAEPDPWGGVAWWFQAADLTFGNLEVVLVDGGTPRRAPLGEAQPILLSASPASTYALAMAHASFRMLRIMPARSVTETARRARAA